MRLEPTVLESDVLADESFSPSFQISPHFSAPNSSDLESISPAPTALTTELKRTAQQRSWEAAPTHVSYFLATPFALFLGMLVN